MRTVRRLTADLNTIKHDAIVAMCEAYGREKQYWLTVFAQKPYRPLIKRHRKVRDEAVKSGYQSPHGLQARMWKLALVDAAETWDKYWKALFQIIKPLVYKRNDWSDEQRHYANWLMVNYDQFSKLLNHDVPAFKELSRQERIPVARWLHKKIRQHQGQAPRVKIRRSLVLDADCYTVFEQKGVQYLNVMTLKKGQRIALPLKGKTAIAGTIKLVVNHHQVEAHVGFALKSKAIVSDHIEAVDFGFTEAMVDTDGNAYGKNLGSILSAASHDRHTVGKARNQLRALAERYQASQNKKHRKKAKRIRQHNLGKIKWRQREERTQAAIACEINQGINQLLRERQPVVLVTESLRNAFTFSKPKAINRKLAGWTRGILQDRVGFKSLAEGFRHQAVNAAYGSQLCSKCGYVDAKNRTGDKFKCLYCGHADHADRNAAVNYRHRLGDLEITLFTPYQQVKTILMARFSRRLETERKFVLAVGAQDGINVTVQGKTPDTELTCATAVSDAKATAGRPQAA